MELPAVGGIMGFIYGLFYLVAGALHIIADGPLSRNRDDLPIWRRPGRSDANSGEVHGGIWGHVQVRSLPGSKAGEKHSDQGRVACSWALAALSAPIHLRWPLQYGHDHIILPSFTPGATASRFSDEPVRVSLSYLSHEGVLRLHVQPTTWRLEKLSAT